MIMARTMVMTSGGERIYQRYSLSVLYGMVYHTDFFQHISDRPGVAASIAETLEPVLL